MDNIFKTTCVFILCLSTVFFTQCGGKGGVRDTGDTLNTGETLPTSSSQFNTSMETMVSDNYQGFVVLKANAPQGYHDNGNFELLDPTISIFSDVIDFTNDLSGETE